MKNFTSSAVCSIVSEMRAGKISNYIAPGLESYLLNKNDCKTRLFHMTEWMYKE